MTEINNWRAINLWIREMMVNEEIEVCPRCCQNLTYKDPLTYLEGKGIEKGRGQKVVEKLASLGISRGYHLFADCEEGQLETSGTEFYLCAYCAQGGVSIYEKSEEWPIEGRFPKSLTRS